MKTVQFTAMNEAETLRLGEDISLVLSAGELIALSGALGVGKSTFARGLIRHLLRDDEAEIASPTYTLCNTYDGDIQIAHFDLYRLESAEELTELGLDEALEVGCVIVEWPEKAMKTLPEKSVHVQISEGSSDTRTFEFKGDHQILDKIERTLKIRRLLEDASLPDARRYNLDADASARRYEEVFHQGELKLLVMDSPEMPDGPPVVDGLPYSRIAHLAENVSAFFAIGTVLLNKGISAPRILVSDLKSGLLLVEYLGNGKIVTNESVPIPDRYKTAAVFLAELHEHAFDSSVPLPNGTKYPIPSYDQGALLIELDLLPEWYIPHFAGKELGNHQKQDFLEVWKTLIGTLNSEDNTLVLRDFHSPNIIWLEERLGTSQIGVIDFQDAVIGPRAYDVASLAQDARVDVCETLEIELLETYIEKRELFDRGFDATRFRTDYAIMSAQRATKILGIFCRLHKRDNKPQYLAHIPRLKDYLQRSLKHPVLAEYRKWLETVIDL
ncbi:MAG: tRNA (adenosine(37)-N6)-threonylcarbamoyltransferase complex ATPase subunit type 1 TsaE [Pseudomonadota bacterium]